MEKDTADVHVGQNIRELRQSKGLTQAQLAEAIGVSPTFISRVERGEKSMSLQKLQCVAKYFRVSCDALIDGPGSNTHIQNIVVLLADCSETFIAWAEEMLRCCINVPCSKMTGEEKCIWKP